MTLVEVHLIGIPLDVHREAAEHSAEVLREFSHLAEGPAASHAPARLIELNRVLQERFGGFTQAASAELDAALAERRPSLDLVFSVPSEVGQGARDLAELWDEVDRYCEEGDYLLALRTPPRAVAYRRWFLEEFERQAAGEPATSWPDWERAAAG